ncbi:hypothetical protein Syun_023688 [Stephania yunnanensis]|uniref:Uncharacterized protein n=1 Tax=Stephania yunnanensis TaxID=152371 RepID=A0AAP0FCZ7_9MAGN
MTVMPSWLSTGVRVAKETRNSDKEEPRRAMHAMEPDPEQRRRNGGERRRNRGPRSRGVARHGGIERYGPEQRRRNVGEQWRRRNPARPEAEERGRAVAEKGADSQTRRRLACRGISDILVSIVADLSQICHRLGGKIMAREASIDTTAQSETVRDHSVTAHSSAQVHVVGDKAVRDHSVTDHSSGDIHVVGDKASMFRQIRERDRRFDYG